MCGIFCEICFSNVKPTKDPLILECIKNRGPNCTQSLEISLGDGVTGFLCAAVLWMQGRHLVPQPAEHNEGVLLYNGDIFDETWDSNMGDTQIILQQLSNEGINENRREPIYEKQRGWCRARTTCQDGRIGATTTISLEKLE